MEGPTQVKNVSGSVPDSNKKPKQSSLGSKVNKDAAVFFPSIHNMGFFGPAGISLSNNHDVPLVDQTYPRKSSVHKISWLSGLANLPYEPLRFFKAPMKGEYSPQPNLQDEICEVEIQIKEMELETMIGKGPDLQKYHILKSIKENKLKAIKTLMDFQMEKVLSQRGF